MTDILLPTAAFMKLFQLDYNSSPNQQNKLFPSVMISEGSLHFTETEYPVCPGAALMTMFSGPFHVIFRWLDAGNRMWTELYAVFSASMQH